MFTNSGEENVVDCPKEVIETSLEFEEVYFAPIHDDQLQKVHLNNQVCHFKIVTTNSAHKTIQSRKILQVKASLKCYRLGGWFYKHTMLTAEVFWTD